ncbi:MAG TPA: PilZ domain-containing protein [Nitrospiria bacterium]|nr:PilZ domain-containing protein [Candidatus Manganitrophaceae bacterium]HIL33959.1 PilZ domain-containing protein [Candidatus Manganitrophaceae bacterium]
MDRENRRIADRHGLEKEVAYEPSASLELGQRRYYGLMLNISNGGFCLKTETPLTRSQIIQVQMPIPEMKSSLPTLAEVCWVDSHENQGGYTVGLRYLI